MDSSIHYQLQEKCGARRVAFRFGDRVAVIYLSESCTGEKIICHTVDAGFLPLEWDRGYNVGSMYFCIEGRCGCVSPDAAAVHTDCYNLYLQLATGPERLNQLHRIATSRRAWRECNPQIDDDTRSDKDFLVTKAREILPELELLPNELKAEVCSFLGNDTLSRYSAVRTLVNGLSPEPGGEWLRLVPLAHVQYWHRGASPVLSGTPVTARRRLVIDSQGLRAIESSETPASQSQPGVEVFVPAAPPDTTCDFRYGTCRLSAAVVDWWNTTLELPVIWNIPSPPDLRDCTSLSVTTIQPRNFTAVDLSICFGITFFTCGIGIVRTHAHTKSQPTAEETYKRLTQHRQNQAMWIYVPLPSEDKLLGFGPRFSNPRVHLDIGHCFRTSLRGDFTVGRGSGPDGVPHWISRRSLLIHDLDEHQDGFSNPVGMHYIYPRSDECGDFSPTKPRSGAYSPGPYECFSSAPLESVRMVSIYRTTRENFHDGVFCQGLIIDYMDGAQRALGSCPVGVIPAECCTDIRHVRFSCTTSESQGSTVVIEVDPPISDDENHDEGWTRFVEGATLEVWFTRWTMHMSLVLDSDEEKSNGEKPDEEWPGGEWPDDAWSDEEESG